MQYFILPTSKVNLWLLEDFGSWLATPGKDGRPHAADKKKRNLSYRQFAKSWNLTATAGIFYGKSEGG
jgi:hypothetical protein